MGAASIKGKFCVIVIAIAIVSLMITLFLPLDFGTALSGTGKEPRAKNDRNATFSHQHRHQIAFNKNITQRGKWQQAQLENYCLHNGNPGKIRWDLMLYEDSHKILYCTVPKIAGTTMKTMMVLLQGLYTMDNFNNTIVTHGRHLQNALKLCMNPCDKPKDEYKVNDYYKFMLVRDPLERIVSVYYNKLKTKESFRDYQDLQKKILQYYNDRNSQFPSFRQFIGFFNYSQESFDRHFIPTINLCDPCRIKYDFYGNFKMINQDIDSLLQLLNIPREYYFNNIKHLEPLMPRSIHYNVSFIIDHFKQLSSDQRIGVFKILAKELELYESLYPGELDVYYSTFTEFQQSVKGIYSQNG